MTVQAGAPKASPVDRAEAEQLFADIFRQYFKRITAFVRSRLHPSHASHAEDLTQQTFIAFWTGYAAQGRLEDVESPFGLLATIARGEIGAFYAIKSKTMGTPIDFADPLNGPILATGHAYVPETPELAFLERDLEAAMVAMTVASKQWREKDKIRGKLSRQLNNPERFCLGGLTPETKARKRTELVQAEADEARALLAFREACETVANLRGELERSAGPNWKSASGMPASLGTRRREDTSFTSNPEVTHCSEGHLLDRDSTYFYEDGTRSCRYCSAKRTADNLAKKRVANPPANQATRTVDTDVIEQARKLLMDPNCTLSIDNIAKSLGISSGTLYKRLPTETAGRKSRRDIDADRLDAARKLLADPANDKKTLQQIADAVGCSYASIKRHLRTEIAARQNAPIEAARAMLADPAYLHLSVFRIAKQAGTSDNRLYAVLPVAELRQAAKAKAEAAR